jgi:hypothetical protein
MLLSEPRGISWEMSWDGKGGSRWLRVALLASCREFRQNIASNA